MNVRSFVPRSLPLTGPDYQVDIARGNPGQNVRITKQGNQIAVTHQTNPADDALITVGNGTVAIHRPHGQDVAYRQAGNQIAIDRQGIGQDVLITQTGNQLTVDRYGANQDVSYRRSPGHFEIDRFGYVNDVAVNVQGETVSIDRGQNYQDTAVRLPGGDFDPTTWQQELSLDPQAWQTVHHWFDQGHPDLSDLITLTEQGQILEWDGLLR